MEGLTNQELEKEKEKEALDFIVQPELDYREALEVFLEENDFNQVLKRITSVPEWREDTQLVNMFVLMRQRKRAFLSVPFIEQDMEIVLIHVYFPEYPMPNLTVLSSRVERELTILVFSFLAFNGRNQYWKRAYDAIYSQIEAIKDWKQSGQLVYLRQLMKAEERKNSFNVEHYGLIYTRRHSQRGMQIQKILTDIEKQRKENPIFTKKSLIHHIHYIRGFEFWSEEEQLRKRHKQLVSEYRIFRLKENGNWKDRIQGISDTKEDSDDLKRTDRGENSGDETTELSPQPAAKVGVLRNLWNFLCRSKT